MDHKMKEKIPHRLSPHFVSSDEGPETGEDSEDDLVTSYLPNDSRYGLIHQRGFDQCGDRMYEKNDIPAINITLHSPNANRVLEAEICQLADIQDNIQRMREGDILEHQNIDSRLSTSCPSLAVEAVKRKKTRNTQQRYRRRSDRNRSPSMSTGDSDEDMDRDNNGSGGGRHASATNANLKSASMQHHTTQLQDDSPNSVSGYYGGGGGSMDTPDGGSGGHQSRHPGRDRSSSLRPSLYSSSPMSGGGIIGVGGNMVGGVSTGGITSQHISLEAVNSMAKSVSTPHIPRMENGMSGVTGGGREEYLVNTFGKSPRRRRTPEPTHVFIQKLIAEHGWSKQGGSGTDSETEGDDVAAANINYAAAAAAAQRAAAAQQHHLQQQHISPQLTLAEFLQNTTAAGASEEDQRKRRRNKKERGGSLFSLRKKKEKKEGGNNNNNPPITSSAVGAKGLTKAGSAASLSRPVSVPRVPQHSYSMSSIKRYPHQPSSAQWHTHINKQDGNSSPKRGEGRRGPPPSPSPSPSPSNRWRRVGRKLGVIKPSWTEDGVGKEELDGDEDHLLEAEVPPGEELPQAFSLHLKNLDVDPFLRLQKEEADTWANSIPPGVHSALKPHEAKRQEHIYEFIMTEKHHCQLLKVIQRVFCEGMVSCLDMKPELLDKLFPQLENLINLHFHFLRQLRTVQDCGTVIPSIADVLLNQFNAEAAVHWQSAYGAFCSQHTQAVNLYKDLLKTDRRFHEFVQQSSQNPMLRKMGIPECILTISTRITKYPLLIEPLIKTAKDRPEERKKLEICHRLVKSILVDVNGQVAEKERAQRLIEIYNKLDAKSYIQIDGRKFKKSDFLMENRKLLFEGVCTLTHPQISGSGPVSASRGNRSPAPTPVNIVVLSDVLVFLQESSQKYVFVSPENRTGIVPVHTLLAKEKPGSDNKALQIISTTGDTESEPDVYELAVVQPRDRQDWINGIRRAVDLSGGGSLAESSLEIEMEKGRRHLSTKYMRMQQKVGELRERDMDLARTMEAKMQVFADIFEELGIQHKLPEIEYTKLVQEQKSEYTSDDVLREINAALQIASTLPGGAQKSVDSDQLVSIEDDINGGASGESDPAGSEASVSEADVPAVTQLTHHLNNILCIVSEKFTSHGSLKVEVCEWKEKAALGLGRYKQNQQLEHLRTQQDELAEDRRTWAIVKQEQEREFRTKQEALAKLQASLEQEKKDVEQQRDKLYRKLEALKAQGIDISPNMTVIGASQTQQQDQPHFIMEVRKAVSPAADGSGVNSAGRKGGTAQMVTSSGQPMAANSLAGTGSCSASLAGGGVSVVSASNSSASLVNQNLLSATIQTKGEVVEVKQQIPSKLAKLSLAGGNKNREKKNSSVTRPSVTSLQQQAAAAGVGGTQQLLPYKLSESDKKNSTSSLSVVAAASGGTGVSPKGYQKLSSSSFAEDRVGRPTYRGEDTSSHARTGSSPAAMSGRPMSSSNTLPKLSSQPRVVMSTAGSSGSAEASPPPNMTSHGFGGNGGDRSAGAMIGGHHGGPHSHHGHPHQSHHQPMLHRVNYSDTGEEVFFF